jgi:predicted RNA polymerase sigma factor
MRFVRRDAESGGIETAVDAVAGIGQALAAATVSGPKIGLAMLEPLQAELENDYRLIAARAHLLEMAGHEHDALEEYRAAAQHAPSHVEERYLLSEASRLRELLENSGPGQSIRG